MYILLYLNFIHLYFVSCIITRCLVGKNVNVRNGVYFSTYFTAPSEYAPLYPIKLSIYIIPRYPIAILHTEIIVVPVVLWGVFMIFDTLY